MPCVENGRDPTGPSLRTCRHYFPLGCVGGAAPLRMHNGMTVIAEAEIRGHWQAAEIMRAQTDRADNVTKFFSWPLSIDSWATAGHCEDAPL